MSTTLNGQILGRTHYAARACWSGSWAASA